MRADGLNVSRFVREQLEVLFADESLEDSRQTKDRLVQAARKSSARLRAAEAEREADLARPRRRPATACRA